jgi:hypothetical protein
LHGKRLREELSQSQREGKSMNFYSGGARGRDLSSIQTQLLEDGLWTGENRVRLDGLIRMAIAAGEHRWVFDQSKQRFQKQPAFAAFYEDTAFLRDMGLRVTAMRRLNPLRGSRYDTSVAADIFGEGLRIVCSVPVEPLTVKGRPTCSATLELPYPFSVEDQNLWGKEIIGFQPLILDADTKAADNPPSIIWTPKTFTANWLGKKLFNVLKALPNFATVRAGRVLVRLRLEGNFIWAASDARSSPKTYLDGDVRGKLPTRQPTQRHWTWSCPVAMDCWAAPSKCGSG